MKSIFDFTSARLGVLIALAIIGLINIAYPFDGDQALFMVGARMLSRGAVLYRDFWDLKQPGIYWFYLLAGMFGGFNSVGVHLFEVIWFSLLAALLLFRSEKLFASRAAAVYAALFTVGVYFAVVSSWHLTQLEGLISLPLLVAALLVLGSSPPTAWRWLLFGAMVGLVGLFKLMLIVLPGTFAIVALWPHRDRSAGTLARQTMIAVFCSAVGVAAIWVPTLLHFAAAHQLPVMWQTFFVDPPRIVRELHGNSISVLLRGGKWFALTSAPLLVLCVVAFARRWRQPTRFQIALVLWIVVAFALVLIQRMWWEYHFLLVLFPVGLLAAFGLEDALACAMTFKKPLIRGVAAAALVLVIFGPYAARLSRKAIVQTRYLTNPDGVEQFDRKISPSYASAAAEADWLTANTQRSDSVYVMGNPLILYLSNQPQPLPLNGWSPEFFLKDQWADLNQEILKNPPTLIFIESENQPLLAGIGKALQQTIQNRYRISKSDQDGVWYWIR